MPGNRSRSLGSISTGAEFFQQLHELARGNQAPDERTQPGQHPDSDFEQTSQFGHAWTPDLQTL